MLQELSGGEKDEPQFQMERIPSECMIEMAEHGRARQRSAVHREGMLSGIYTGTSSGYVQYAAEIGIVGHECWMNITSRKCINLCELCSCSHSCVRLPQGNPQA